MRRSERVRAENAFCRRFANAVEIVWAEAAGVRNEFINDLSNSCRFGLTRRTTRIQSVGSSDGFPTIISVGRRINQIKSI